MTSQHKKYHTIWLSDIHLGNPNCQGEKLYEFLKSLENDNDTYNVVNLFLVGDIIDMTQFNHKVFWSCHRKIIKKFFRMADKGVKITYIRGNHDYFLEKEFLQDNPNGVTFNGITFAYNATYTNLKGETFFILHGDEFDGMVRTYPIMYKVGDLGYKFMIFVNRWQNGVRRLLKLKPWSLNQWVKQKAKRIVQHVNNYENLVAQKAKSKNVNGIVCGHIHKAEDRYIGEIRYLNCGCWVEFCSYIAEDKEGNIEKVIYYEES